jgi:hypothetical protein
MFEKRKYTLMDLLLFIGVIITVRYIFNKIYTINAEGFTPAINGQCRPYIRNIRKTGEKHMEYMENISKHVVSFMRKWYIY